MSRKKNSGCSITTLVLLLGCLSVCRSCGKQLTSQERTATHEVWQTTSEAIDKSRTETVAMHRTNVEIMREETFVQWTVDAIFRRTEWPTIWYEATVEAVQTSYIRNMTVEAILTKENR